MRVPNRWISTVLMMAVASLAGAQNYTYTVVADNSGTFNDFNPGAFPPSMANNGAVTFYANFDSSAGEGMYYWDGASILTVKFDPAVGDLNGFFGPANVSEDGLSLLMKDRFGASPRIEGWTLGSGTFIVYDQNPTPFNNVQTPDLSHLGECCFSATGSGGGGIAKGWIGTMSYAVTGSMLGYSRISNAGDIAYENFVSGVYTMYRNGTPLDSTNASLFAIDEDMGMNASGTVAYICHYFPIADELVIHDGTTRTVAIHTSGPYRALGIGNHGAAINTTATMRSLARRTAR